MKIRLLLPSLAAALSFALALPAFGAEAASRDEQRLALLNAHAGEPVTRVKFLRPLHSYEMVGPLNVLVWETPTRAWLLDLRKSDACQYLDREFKISIDTLTDSINSTNGYVRARGGQICRIDRLREVDVKAWKDAERLAGIRK